MPTTKQGVLFAIILLTVIVTGLFAAVQQASNLIIPAAVMAVAGALGLGLLLGRKSGTSETDGDRSPSTQPTPTDTTDTPGQSVRATLSDRVVFGRITAAILEDFVHCTADDFEINMSRVLSRLGSYTGASRCYLYRENDSGASADLVLSWSRPGETGPVAPPSRLDSLQSELHDWLRKDHLTLVGDLEKDDPTCLDRCPQLTDQGVRALGAAPIQQQGKLLGFLGFDSQDTHQWGPQEANLLLLVADLFVAIWSKLDAEKALHEAMENLRASDRAKTDFLANMSHEIRTPMNCILGISDLLREMEPTDRQLSYLNMIHHSGNSLLTLINEILDLSKIEAGQLVLDPVETNLRRLIEETLSLIAFQAQGKGLEIACRLDPEVPETLLLDPGRLRQVLTNLLNNATKFTAVGHVLLDIQAIPRDAKTIDLCFTVQDTGVGIPDDKLEMIFDKFTQAEVSTTRQYGGTGLGLAISQNLVSLMGGQIAATSRIGVGSSFSFTIPVQPIKAAPVHTVAGDVTGVLVVTGSKVGADVLVQMLTTLQVPVQTVTTWELACDRILETPRGGARQWSHVLLDSRVCQNREPDVSGALSRVPDNLRPRVMLMTSLTDLYLDSDLTDRGFAGSLNKPVFLPKLVATLAGRSRPETHPAQPVCPLDHTDDGRADFAPLTPDAPRLRVLLVEDNVFNQKVAMGMLKLLNCDTELVDNGQKALDRAAETDFDLIFMDCQMPVMDGFEATRRIRGLPGRRGTVPIVAMTANALQRDLDACLDAGMNDTTTKPITRERLQDILTQWVKVGTPA